MPFLNLDDPAKSLLLLKPTARLPKPNEDGARIPTYTEPVSHAGGLKMHVDDPSYKGIVAWIRDYARLTRDEYKNVDELPSDNWYPSQIVLGVKDTPEDWPKLTRRAARCALVERREEGVERGADRVYAELGHAARTNCRTAGTFETTGSRAQQRLGS